MSVESWVQPGDDLSNFDGSKPWPDQIVNYNGVELIVPASTNYRFGNRAVSMASRRDEFIDMVSDNPVVILSGNTGSGKTTLGAQALMESELGSKVIQPQPRIILARNACYRVRQEMDYAMNQKGYADKRVGYTTSTDSEVDPENEILMATYGAALKMVIHGGKEINSFIFNPDEVHLREIEADILIGLCAKRGLKLVISSATMNAEKMAETYSNVHGEPAPILSIDVPRFETTYVEPDKEGLIADIVKYKKEDTVIFLPGRKNITRSLGQSVRKIDTKVNAMLLHGQQSRAAQQRVFDTTSGVRHIHSTNVGEMGVTFDVDVVINPGYERAPMLIDGVLTLTERVAPQSTNRQREGRTARTRNGTVVFGSKMEGYPKLPPLDQIPLYDTPGILRSRLDSGQLLLSVIDETFDTLPLADYPESQEVTRTMIRLRRIGVYDEDDKLTEIGREVEQYSVDPNYARMIVESARYEEEFPSLKAQMIAIASVEQAQGIMSTEQDGSGWRTVIPNDSRSDLMFGMRLFKWALQSDRTNQELQQKGIIEPSLKRARDLYESNCKKQGIDPDSLRMPQTDAENEAIIACILSGVDEVFVRSGEGTYRDIRGDRRYLQSATTVGTSPILVGIPWNLQTYKGEVLTMRRYVSSPTAVTREQLEKYAPHRCTYSINGYCMDTWGNITAKNALYFDGQYIDDKNRVSVEPGAQLRDYMVDVVFSKALKNKKNLSPTLSRFHQKILDLHYMQHKTHYDLAVHEKIQAARNKLAELVPETVLTLDDLDPYLDPMILEGELNDVILQEVESSAPDYVTFLDESSQPISVPVEYNKNQVHVRVTKQQLNYLPNSFPELGDREIRVKIDNGSRLHTIEDAFDRALSPNRAHRRNNIRDIQTANSIRKAKDESWDGSRLSPRGIDVEYAPSRIYRRTQYK